MLIAQLSHTCRLGMPVPILMDWVVILAYVLATFFCFLASQLANKSRYIKSSKFWLIMSLLVLMLGLNKFLFFENCITITLSNLAKTNGWYDLRRGIQAEFIIIVLFLIIGALLGFISQLKGAEKSLYAAIIFLVMLLILVMLRIISLHQIDALLYPDLPVLGIGLNWVIELTFSLGIAICALICINTQPKSKVSI